MIPKQKEYCIAGSAVIIAIGFGSLFRPIKKKKLRFKENEPSSRDKSKWEKHNIFQFIWRQNDDFPKYGFICITVGANMNFNMISTAQNRSLVLSS